SIRIEDHYYTRNDAAVVFQYHNNHTGETRYIYHGNDGTSIPWNDTAQLNFLLPEVREAVTQMIIQIAKRFPVIRFDAAMTLARKHIQRLWFPEPGQGGDIPSRAEHGLTKAEFNRLMPEEFWRTVVDRVEQEAPHTLLLAEAFWMMEGYFVRTLGMHRVYNSAFMNMLKNEDNAAYRQSILNIIEFNPQILKRFVNFMSNPDEETAIAQFGNDDKYFGVCVLMCTMPGLPMFAHGQIEGFQERYGMEFLRARWDEQENQYLINRHQQEIFPLLKKRYLFAEVDNFLLFDFQTDYNGLNENVFAYLNKFRNETALVIYNNKYDRTSGRIYQTDYLEKQSSGSKRIVKKLSAALNLHNSPDHYLIFRDVISGLFYISSCSELHHHGLRQTLDGFKYKVYLDFVEVVDNQDRNYSELHLFLQGSGVQNIDRSIMQIRLKNTLNNLEELSSPRLFKHFLHMIEQGTITSSFFEEMAIRLEDFFSIFQQEFNPETDSKIALTNALEKFRNWNFNSPIKISEDQKSDILSLIWIILSSLKNLIPNDVSRKDDFSWIEDLNFSQKIYANLQPWFEDINETRFNALLQICLKWDNLCSEDFGEKIIDLLTNDSHVQIFLKINEYNKILWFDDQAFDLLWHCLLQISLINLKTDERPESKNKNKIIADFRINMLSLFKAKQASEFKVEILIREISLNFKITN
ncbi:MAG: hypothetical protein JW996_04250, partial [Candidatus Cloacimonetes bacterium]|nr:hypothetical protein [Candidatus Cloacimonadota bacterium]